MSEIIKVKVGRGATKEGQLYYFEVEATVPSDTSPELVKVHGEGLVEGWLGSALSTVPPTQTEKPTPPKPAKISIEDACGLFPKDIESNLEFSEDEDYIIIRPRKYLGTESFAKIASIVRNAGGEYISAGRDSHFRLAKK